MSRVILVTSLKGGVGKTTVAANLAMTLAQSGHTVVAVDCDLESRCLDMVLGLENDTLYNFSDVLCERCTLDDALLYDDRCDKLAFLAAPSALTVTEESREEYDAVFTPESIDRFMAEVKDRFDYVVFDLPAHPDRWYSLLLKHTNFALIVAMHTAVSIRSAEKTAMTIAQTDEALHEEDGSTSTLKIRLVVNGFRYREAASGARALVGDIIGKTSVRLIGVIPQDEVMASAQESGKLAFQLKKGTLPFSIAIANIAERIDGAQVPLLSGIVGRSARKKVL